MGTLTGKQSTMTLLTMSALWRKDTAGILAQLKQSIHLRRHRSGSFPRVTRVRIRIYTDDEEVNSEASWMGACIQQASEKELFAPASLLPVDLELPLFWTSPKTIPQKSLPRSAATRIADPVKDLGRRLRIATTTTASPRRKQTAVLIWAPVRCSRQCGCDCIGAHYLAYSMVWPVLRRSCCLPIHCCHHLEDDHTLDYRQRQDTVTRYPGSS